MTSIASTLRTIDRSILGLAKVRFHLTIRAAVEKVGGKVENIRSLDYRSTAWWEDPDMIQDQTTTTSGGLKDRHRIFGVWLKERDRPAAKASGSKWLDYIAFHPPIAVPEELLENDEWRK